MLVIGHGWIKMMGISLLAVSLRTGPQGLKHPRKSQSGEKSWEKNRFNCHPEPFDIGNTSQLICFTLGLTNLGRQLFFLLIRTLTVDHVPTDQGVEFKMLVP